MKNSMKKSSRAAVAVVSIALVIAIGAMTGRTANAATPTVNLKSAASFSILAGTPAITNVGAGTHVNADVGIHPAAVVGLLPAQVGGAIHAADAAALQAKSDLKDAYDDAKGRGATVPDPVSLAGGALVGMTLDPGVYNSGAGILDLTGTLTLDAHGDASAVWIFQAQSSLIAAVNSKVALKNGAQPCNVFWQVTSSADLKTGTSFVGTLLALTAITLGDSVTVQGRALARNDKVTLINDQFTSAACAAAPAAPAAPAGGGSGTSGKDTKEVPPAVVPEATPIPAPVIPAGQMPTNMIPVTAPAPSPVVAGVQVLPSTSTETPLSPLVMIGIALAAFGLLLLVRRPIRSS